MLLGGPTACRQSHYHACHACCWVLFLQHVATKLHLGLSMPPSIQHAWLSARLHGLACAGFPVYWDVALTANSSQRELQYLKDGAFLDVASSGMRMLLLTYSTVLDAFGCVLHVAQLGRQVAPGRALDNTCQSVSQASPFEMLLFCCSQNARAVLLLAGPGSTVRLTQTSDLPAQADALLSFVWSCTRSMPDRCSAGWCSWTGAGTLLGRSMDDCRFGQSFSLSTIAVRAAGSCGWWAMPSCLSCWRCTAARSA